VVTEENVLRRDQCECPECKEKIYLCRSPGCHDFAKGTSVYDHELCPSCTKTVSDAASEVGSAVLKVAGTVATTLILSALSGKGAKGGGGKGK
jgi:hypothetical protein